MEKIQEELLTEKQRRYIESIDTMHEYPNLNTAQSVVESKIYLSHLALQKAEIFTLGKPHDWKNDHRSNPEFFKLLKENHIEKLYVPKANTFNGRLCDSDDFKDEYLTHGIKIMINCVSDGLEIPPGSAALIPTADCPTIVYHDITNDILIAAHAGLGSVVDLGLIKNGIGSRNHEGVVDEIMRHAGDTEDYEIFILCGIHHESFIYDIVNPKFLDSNIRILLSLLENCGINSVPLGLNHGGISINGIIKHQFQKYGIDVKRIRSDGIDTYKDSRFWSHSRYVHKELGYCGRNGVLVMHKK